MGLQLIKRKCINGNKMATATQERTFYKRQSRQWRNPKWTAQRIEALADSLAEWIKDEKNYFLGRFLAEHAIDYPDLEDFSKMNDFFRNTLQKARATQEHRIVERSLERKFDGSFARFVLANKAGWRERLEQSIDTQSPLVALLASVDGGSKQIIKHTDVLEPGAITMKSLKRNCDGSNNPRKARQLRREREARKLADQSKASEA
jgi:hypothetical protein